MFRAGPLLLGVIALVALPARSVDHKLFKDSSLAGCRECHGGQGVIDNHGASFVRDHRLLAAKAQNNCHDCHQQSSCDDCHRGRNLENVQKTVSHRGEGMPKTHATDYISIHAFDAKADPRGCVRCHESASFCSDCHQQRIKNNRNQMNIRPHSPTFVGPGVPDPAWASFHAADARRNLQTCQGCHPQKSDCSNFACHPGLKGR